MLGCSICSSGARPGPSRGVLQEPVAPPVAPPVAEHADDIEAGLLPPPPPPLTPAELRTGQEIVQQNLPSVTRWIRQIAPYAGLLLLTFLTHHFIAISVFAGLTLVLHRANNVLKQQVALWVLPHMLLLLYDRLSGRVHVSCGRWLRRVQSCWFLRLRCTGHLEGASYGGGYCSCLLRLMPLGSALLFGLYLQTVTIYIYYWAIAANGDDIYYIYILLGYSCKR